MKDNNNINKNSLVHIHKLTVLTARKEKAKLKEIILLRVGVERQSRIRSDKTTLWAKSWPILYFYIIFFIYYLLSEWKYLEKKELQQRALFIINTYRRCIIRSSSGRAIEI